MAYEYDKPVTDMLPGDQIEGFYILSDIQIKTSSSGSPYVSARISDAGGAMDAKIWNFAGGLGDEDNGRVFKLRGEVGQYKGSPQFSIQRIRPADDGDHYDLADLVPSAPIDAEKAAVELRSMVESMRDGDYRAICLAMLDRCGEAFFSIPAAKSFHHAFLSGLLMHTLNMMRIADFLAGLYAEVIDRDLLLAGTMLHDVGKNEEFALSPLGLVSDYTPRGKLLGHLYICAEQVAALARELGADAEKAMLLQHLILSHHGTPEFGAAVVPQCAESELLSYIDLIDSRMEIYAETLEDTPPGQFSPRVYALDKALYNHGRNE
ncbi:MAG: HD domain-containing protein [Oscillospiraceae bacterium]|nr:HD domain-containing protein [Oscillospiraceae bacterium]